MMAKDLGDAIGTALGKAARAAVQNVSASTRGRNGALSGMKGLAAGVGAGDHVPVAAKGAGKLVKGPRGNGAAPMQKAGQQLGGGVKDALGGKGKGGKGGKSPGVPGVGKGRRMPIQLDIDVAVPP